MNSNNQSERQSGCMTNYIEQLMKAAGVVPVHLTDCSFINIRKGYDVGTDCCPAVEDERLKCEDCEHSKETQLIYPAFTPAKQLELIKLIVNAKKVECFFIQTNKKFYKISCLIETTNFPAAVIATDPVMDIALAKLLIKLLKKCELDKSEVKKILED